MEIKIYFCKNITSAQGSISYRLGEETHQLMGTAQTDSSRDFLVAQAQAKIWVRFGTYPKGKHTQPQQTGTLIRVITYENNIKGRVEGRERAPCIIRPGNSSTEKLRSLFKVPQLGIVWVLENACLAPFKLSFLSSRSLSK